METFLIILKLLLYLLLFLIAFIIIILLGVDFRILMKRYERSKLKPLKKPLKINGKEVNGIGFAWDGDRRIFILENEKEVSEAEFYDYKIYPIKDLKSIWDISRYGIRFICRWGKSEFYVDDYEDDDEKVVFEY